MYIETKTAIYNTDNMVSVFISGTVIMYTDINGKDHIIQVYGDEDLAKNAMDKIRYGLGRWEWVTLPTPSDTTEHGNV